MIIFVKNKYTLQVDDFKLKCCIGKNGSTGRKKRVTKKRQKEYLKLEIFILEKIVKKTNNFFKMH